MDRQNFFDSQVPGGDQLNQIQTDAEVAVGRVVADHLLRPGVLTGLIPSQQASPNMTVQVSAGVAYDGSSPPRRIALANDLASVNLAVDQNGVSTRPSSGNFRWVALAIVQSLDFSEPYTSEEGNGYFRRVEDAALEVWAGEPRSVANNAARPTVPTSRVILAEWLLSNSTTQILDANRSYARRNPSQPTGVRPIAAMAAIETIAGATYDNGQVTPSDPPSLSVQVAPAQVNTGTERLSFAGGSVTLTAPSSQPKWALIYLDAGGAAQVSYGAEGGGKPSHAGVLPLAEIRLTVGQTAVVMSQIVDARPFFGVAATSVGTNKSRQVATAGQTVFTLPFSYPIGLNSLEVFKNGLRLDSSQFTETSSTSVTLGTAAGAADVLFFRALIPAVASMPAPHAGSHSSLGSDPLDYSAANGLISANFVAQSGTPTQTGGIITVFPLSMVCGGLLLCNRTSIVVGVGNLDGGGSIAASTWYYLYGFANPDQTQTQKILFQLSATPPDSANQFKSTDPAKVYLCAWRTKSAGLFVPGVRRGRRTQYFSNLGTDWDSTPFGARMGLVTAGSKYMSCAKAIPPTTRHGIFWFEQLSSAAVTAATLGTPFSESDTSGQGQVFARIAIGARGGMQAEGLTDLNQRVLLVGDNNLVELDVLGFIE
jgi:hypothetical protein